MFFDSKMEHLLPDMIIAVKKKSRRFSQFLNFRSALRADHICGCGGDDNGMQSGEGAKFLSNRFQSILRELIVDRKKNQRYDSPKLIVK